MSGRVPARPIPTIAMGLAATSAGGIGLSGRAVGRAIFTLKGTDERATLILHQGNRVVTARAAEITGALVGVSLSATRLLRVLTGCAVEASADDRVERVGDVLRVTAADAVVYLTQRQDGWRVRAATFQTFTVDYQQFNGSAPQVMKLTTAAGLPRAELTLTLGDVLIDSSVAPGLLAPVVPDGAVPITLDELRDGL